MSRILARSVTADLVGRLFNRLLFVLLLPFILIHATLPPRDALRRRPVPAMAPRRTAPRPLAPQGDLKSLP